MFFSVAANYMIELFGFDCSIGISRGRAVMGILWSLQGVINFNLYGDIVDQAWDLAEKHKNGIHIAI